MSSAVQPASSSSETAPPPDALCATLNADATVLAVGTPTGFLIYAADPLTLLVDRPFAEGVRRIAIYNQTNLVLFTPQANVSRLVLWDDTRPDGERAVAAIDLDAPVVDARIHIHCIAAADATGQVHLFDASLQLVASYRATDLSPNCLAIAPTPNRTPLLIAMNGDRRGTVRLVHFSVQRQQHQQTDNEDVSSRGIRAGTEGGGQNRCKLALVEPHNSAVACLTPAYDGSLLVTASDRGTTLKVIDTARSTVIRQFNRGSTVNIIHSIGISIDNSLVACVSGSGTVHVFANSTPSSSSLSSGGGTKSSSSSVGVRFNQHNNPNQQSRVASIAKTVTGSSGGGSSANVSAGGGFMQNALGYLSHDFHFAKHSLIDAQDANSAASSVVGPTVIAFRSGLTRYADARCAKLVTAQLQEGKVSSVFIDVSPGIAAEQSGASEKCARDRTARFPHKPL